ncbi:MAG: cytochrome C oxidase subunit I [Burkholderiales bacterium]|nr:cytochrome C oxidase subunit I [Burkholderiales bacterium]
MSDEKPKRSLVSLWLLIAVCAAPMIAAYIAFYLWRPSGQVNYGELIPPRPLPDTQIERVDGTPFRWSQLKGKWAFAIVDSGACDAHCQQKLLYIRQVRLTQGKELDRIERVWLITDGAVPDAAVTAEYHGTLLVRAAGSDLPGAFPAAGSPADHIYVVDPFGNLMMRYPRDADPRLMVKDLARLLKHSKVR